MTTQDKAYHSFLPVAVLAATYLIFSIWQTWIVVDGIRINTEISRQLTIEMEKNKPAASNIDRFYRDLLELGKADPDAKSVIVRNKIIQNQNAP